MVGKMAGGSVKELLAFRIDVAIIQLNGRSIMTEIVPINK